MLRIIGEKFYEWNTDLYIQFVNFKQAFYSEDRFYLYKTLKEFRIQNNWILLIIWALDNARSKVKI